VRFGSFPRTQYIFIIDIINNTIMCIYLYYALCTTYYNNMYATATSSENRRRSGPAGIFVARRLRPFPKNSQTYRPVHLKSLQYNIIMRSDMIRTVECNTISTPILWSTGDIGICVTGTLIPRVRHTCLVRASQVQPLHPLSYRFT